MVRVQQQLQGTVDCGLFTFTYTVILTHCHMNGNDPAKQRLHKWGILYRLQEYIREEEKRVFNYLKAVY